MFNKNYFENLKISKEAEVMFVADLFVDQYVGGAELTSESLIKSSYRNIQKIKSEQLTMDLLEQGKDKYWIFSNFSRINLELIPTIMANLKYSIVEYDYKFCAYRSTEKHKQITGSECNCHETDHGRLISAFFNSAKSLWWMSEKQMERYHQRFPFLENKTNIVLSSVFDDDFFYSVKHLNSNKVDRKGWVVLGSKSWIKGYEDAVKWCKDNNKEYKVLWNMPYSEVLNCLSESEGFVYLPRGGDTCPRMVIEAKMLGCKLQLNDNVQHAKELWFDVDLSNEEDRLNFESYLYAARERFWKGIEIDIDMTYDICAVTFIDKKIKDLENIKRQLATLKELKEVVFLTNSEEAYEQLNSLNCQENILVSFDPEGSWEKVKSKTNCPYIWKFSPEEFFGINFISNLLRTCEIFPSDHLVLSLPHIKLNSIDDKNIVVNHVPEMKKLARNVDAVNFDKEGTLQATDGSNHASFYTQDVDIARQSITTQEQFDQYTEWLHKVSETFPTTYVFKEIK